MNRRDFIRAVGSAAAATVLTGCAALRRETAVAEPHERRRTNFLVVLCDDLGYGDLGCFGHRHIKTPHLDRFAAEGMKLTSCYAAAPVCSPSRAGMLTGRTPYRCGVYDWIPSGSSMHLPASELTVAKLLRRAGYATCHVGKWHCNGKFNSPEQPQPDDHGFEWWFSTQNNARPSHRNPTNFVRNGRPVGPLQGYSSDLIVDEAIDWIENHYDRTRPFCLFVWFHSPHEPIATADRFMQMYEGKTGAIYYGNVTQMDYAFGRLLAALDRLGLSDDTFVLFTSDNGPETLNRYRGAHRSFGSPGPLRGMKLHLYEGGIRVPGIIRWPGKVEAGAVCDEPVNGTDILPTLCGIAGVPVPQDRPIDGVDIRPIFEGRPLQRPVPLYWRYDRALSRPFTVAMRQGRWKLLADNGLTRFELYDLDSDIGERHNLAGREVIRLAQMRKVLQRLHQQIQQQGPKW